MIFTKHFISRQLCLKTLFALLLFCCGHNLAIAQGNVAPKTATEKRLEETVTHLSKHIGPRNLKYPNKLDETADWIEGEFKSYGYKVERQKFNVNGRDCFNLIVEITGQKKSNEIVIVGAHYDSWYESPGANDNGSGLAATLFIAEKLAKSKPERSLRFVAFTNEEPPYFQEKGKMGSWVYASECRARKDNIVAMLSLETMGYYSNRPGSQKYPAIIAPFFPNTGNFLGFVSNIASRPLLNDVVAKFKAACPGVPAESASLPAQVEGVGWSDHWSFWEFDYVGVMITDTAPFRYPHYHQKTDTADKLVYKPYAECVDGLVTVVKQLAEVP